MSHKLLIQVTGAADVAPSFVDQLAKNATAFLEARGPVTVASRVSLVRDGRSRRGGESLDIVTLDTAGVSVDGAIARALEGVLRATLAAMGAERVAVSVYRSAA